MFERFSRNARVAIVLAQEEARELNADEIRPEHLLVGVLESAGTTCRRAGRLRPDRRGHPGPGWSPPTPRGDESFDDDAEALRSIGIDLRAVRDIVARTFGEARFDNALRKSGRREAPPRAHPVHAVGQEGARAVTAGSVGAQGQHHWMRAPPAGHPARRRQVHARLDHRARVRPAVAGRHHRAARQGGLEPSSHEIARAPEIGVGRGALDECRAPPTVSPFSHSMTGRWRPPAEPARRPRRWDAPRKYPDRSRRRSCPATSSGVATTTGMPDALRPSARGLDVGRLAHCGR